MRVSFVLAIYNAERTLNECLTSIFNQRYPTNQYEVIVVDGGSKDKTLSIVQKFKQKHSNMRLIHNRHRLSEGKGMGKDQGISAARGDIIILLDHDNILLSPEWTRRMLAPFEADKDIMATQSLLDFMPGDNMFLKYVNAVGVEDPFAVPYSLVSQVVLHPEKFEKKGKWYLHQLDKRKVLFGGANGCAFRKEVFDIIDGYTRDVDVFNEMALHSMKVAVPTDAYLYHNTANSLFNFLKKKGIYFYRFIRNDYGWKKYRWTGTGTRGSLLFFLMVLNNLSFVGPTLTAFKQFFRTREPFWLLHPLYTFFITLEYGLITLMFFPNFVHYTKKRS